MGIVDTKYFTNEDGVEMKTDIYANGMTITRLAKEPEPVEPEPVSDPVLEKLDCIEAKIQTNEDLQSFYDDIVKEAGL